MAPLDAIWNEGLFTTKARSHEGNISEGAPQHNGDLAMLDFDDLRIHFFVTSWLRGEKFLISYRGENAI